MTSAATSPFRLGTSGWAHHDWVGQLYAHDLPPAQYLRTYARHFATVEIEHTFFEMPTRQMVQSWQQRTPDGFTFSPCLPRRLTHGQHLHDVQGMLAEFVSTISALDTKLGPILVQLPEYFRSTEHDTLAAFLALLPSEVRFAVEFRHGSWLKDSTFQLLEQYQVAWVVVDAPFLPRLPRVTTDFAYMRWHGRPGHQPRRQIDPAGAMRPWVPVLQQLAQQVPRVYGYVQNDFSGYAPRDCQTLCRLLGLDEPGQAV